MIGLSSNFRWLLLIVVVAGALLFTGSTDAGPVVFVFVMAGWVASICVHEFGHALAARLGGDHSATTAAYLDFDPARYVDPVGSLLWPALLVAIGAFGFPGGAVYLNPGALRSDAWRSVVSAAGSFASLLSALVLALPLAFGLDERLGAESFWTALALLVELQVVGVLLNLLPIPGFDGYGILEPYLPLGLRRTLEPTRASATLIVLAALVMVPPIGQSFFGAATRLTGVLGVDASMAWDGWQDFRFWRNLR
jgi:Zn-dependent protease